MINVILVVITAFYTGARVIFSKAAKNIRYLAMIILLCLITYWFHGFLNNFLDTDKAAVPYWACIAILVALDIYHVPRELKKKPALIQRLIRLK